MFHCSPDASTSSNSVSDLTTHKPWTPEKVKRGQSLLCDSDEKPATYSNDHRFIDSRFVTHVNCLGNADEETTKLLKEINEFYKSKISTKQRNGDITRDFATLKKHCKCTKFKETNLNAIFLHMEDVFDSIKFIPSESDSTRYEFQSEYALPRVNLSPKKQKNADTIELETTKSVDAVYYVETNGSKRCVLAIELKSPAHMMSLFPADPAKIKAMHEYFGHNVQATYFPHATLTLPDGKTIAKTSQQKIDGGDDNGQQQENEAFELANKRKSWNSYPHGNRWVGQTFSYALWSGALPYILFTLI